MHNYRQHIVVFLKRLVLLYLLYFVSRVFFLLLNVDYFSDMSFQSLGNAFIGGFMFDSAAIVFTNAVFLLFLLPGAYKNHPVVMKSAGLLFFMINCFAILSNFIDARFFDFINKRSTSSIFTLMGTNKDVWLMLPRFLKDYWYVAVSWLILMVAFWKWMPRVHERNLKKEKMSFANAVYQTLIFLGLTGCMLIGARGTKLKPISMIDAASYANLKHVPLVLNTPFSILKTFENNNLQELHYFEKEILDKIYSPIHHPEPLSEFRKKNVVIFILESFSKEYCGYLGGKQGFTPQLDSILRLSLVFPNAFANGTQSYEAMPAIIAGIPSLMEQPYSGSNYADNVIESLPGLLNDKGYFTAFFHGGNNGTMGFENFAHVAGFKKYFGRNEYSNDKDFDGHWGIWDEPFLQYFAKEMDNMYQPFLTTVFTLSSHHPYSIPVKYEGKFPEGDLPVLKTIAYADYALGKFFQTASTMDWFKNTVFIFTADHAAQAVNNVYNSTTGMYAIPLAFYCPSDSLLKGIDNSVCQQIDIMPTVLEYLGYDKPYFCFGKSMISRSNSKWSISYLNGIYQLIEDSMVMQFDGQKVIAFYNMNDPRPEMLNADDKIKTTPVFSSMERDLKAILQTYNYSLIHNLTSYNSSRAE